MNEIKKVLITGGAGFIGAHLAQRLTAIGTEVVALDNLNDYYDPQLKIDRMAALGEGDNFCHANIELSDRGAVEALFQEHSFDAVVNLAAQAGVRYSQ